MKEYMNLLRRYHIAPVVLLIMGLNVIETILGTVHTKFVQISMTSSSKEELVKNVLVTVAIVSVARIIARINWQISGSVKGTFSERYRNDLYKKVMSLSMKELQTLSIPSLTTRIASATDVAEESIRFFFIIISCITSLVSGVFLMYKEDWILATIVTLLTVTMASLYRSTKKKLSEISAERKLLDKKLNTAISRVGGYQTIKSFNNERFEIDNFVSLSSLTRIMKMKKINTYGNLQFLLNGLGSLIGIVIIVYTMILGDISVVSVAKCTLFTSLANNLFNPLASIPEILDMISGIMVSVKDNAELLNLESEADGTINLNSFEESIEFKNVSFSYTESKETLKDVSIKIQKGQKVGIYGPSGSGKSTFVNLLNRFFKINSGEILIDGININDLTAESLRRVIGNINQEVFLFSDMTIRDNICYGIKCSEEELKRAAKLANADVFIEALPDGYDSMVGNNGVLLSGGERQRIALARLFLLNPPILILDEATSKLDNESEALIKDAIENLSKDKTVISIAHRFTTIENSDLFVGVKGHTICEQGDKKMIDKEGTLYHHLKNL